MPEYLVTWEVDVEAESPHAAAEKALEMQRDPGSLATCFTVADVETDETTTIDFFEESLPVLRGETGG